MLNNVTTVILHEFQVKNQKKNDFGGYVEVKNQECNTYFFFFFSGTCLLIIKQY